MTNKQTHWNQIFEHKSDQELGWYEADITQTLTALAPANLDDTTTVFVAGAGTSSLVDELVKRHCHLVLNDISDSALARLNKRLGDGSYQCLHHDLAMPLSVEYAIDVWIDRAVLHFLLTDDEITGYFDNVRRSVVSGGYVLLAEFSITGADKCAGLAVHQYSLEEMQARLGAGFRLIHSEDYIFINPFGEERPYIYALFQRSTKQDSEIITS